MTRAISPVLGSFEYPRHWAGAIFLDATLKNADLRGASLSEAIVRDADFEGANLDGADFRGAVGLTVQQVCAARWRGALLDPDVQAAAQARCGAGQSSFVGPVQR